MFVWFLLEFAGFIGSLGYYLGGSLLTGAVAVLAAVAVLWIRPAHFERS